MWSGCGVHGNRYFGALINLPRCHNVVKEKVFVETFLAARHATSSGKSHAACTVCDIALSSIFNQELPTLSSIQNWNITRRLVRGKCPMCLEVIWELFILDTFRDVGTLKRNFESPALALHFKRSRTEFQSEFFHFAFSPTQLCGGKEERMNNAPFFAQTIECCEKLFLEYRTFHPC